MNNPIQRLALLLPGMYEGGAERIILNLARGLTARGYPVDLILARAEGPYMVQVPDSVRLIDLKASRVLSSLPALIHYLHHERPTVLLSALYTNMIALWARRLCGIPRRVIISEHNTLSSVAENQEDLRWQVFPKLAEWIYPWADGIVAVSKSVADDLAQVARIPRDRIQVVYNPVVTSDLSEKSEAVLEHPWFRKSEPPVVLAVGRLTSQKGFNILIRAFAHLRKTRVVRLMILGEGEERPFLEGLIRQLGLEQDVSLPGFMQNPYPYMVRASLFVLSSRWEGLPTVLVEALYLGTPIIATDCPGGSREILKDGQYGQLVKVDDPFMLADAMERALIAKPPRPPQESWKPFHLDYVIDRYLNLLEGESSCAS
jgi:glycosyltransferase involved in cell wall biosynthesis